MLQTNNRLSILIVFVMNLIALDGISTTMMELSNAPKERLN